MSTILKALQRVEEERPSGAASAPRRALRSDFVPERSKPLLRRSRQRAPSPWLWGSAGAALLLAVLVWWRLPERSAPEREMAAEAKSPARATPPVARQRKRVAPAPDPVAEASAAPPAIAAEPQPAAAAAPPPQPALPAGVAERLPPLGSLDAPSTGTLAPAPPEPSLPAAAPQLAAAVEPAPETGAPEPALVRATPPAPPPQARPAAQPAPPAVAPKPAPPPAPSAPSVLVERTSWHPSAERRLAWVSVEGIPGARELHEGDAVGALVVKEIRPSSVVFLHGADRLQRRVGQRE